MRTALAAMWSRAAPFFQVSLHEHLEQKSFEFSCPQERDAWKFLLRTKHRKYYARASDELLPYFLQVACTCSFEVASKLFIPSWSENKMFAFQLSLFDT
jgi:hypothetical protein